MKSILRWFTLSFVFATAATQTCMASQIRQIPHRTDIIEARVQIKQHEVSAGSPILVRITEINKTAQTYAVLEDVAWMVSELLITNRETKSVVMRSAQVDSNHFHMPVSLIRAPGEEWSLVDLANKDYVDISHWGYHLAPGTYSVCAAPRIVGFMPSSDRKTRRGEFGTPDDNFGNVCDRVTVTSP